MTDRMGAFRTRVELENPLAPGERQIVTNALVDTGAALSWFPADVLRALDARPLKLWHFRQADGTVVARWTTEVRVYAGGTSTIDEVVMGDPSDLVLLGARSLEGLNVRVDPVSMRLVDAGPAPAAVLACLLRERPLCSWGPYIMRLMMPSLVALHVIMALPPTASAQATPDHVDVVIVAVRAVREHAPAGRTALVPTRTATRADSLLTAIVARELGYETRNQPGVAVALRVVSVNVSGDAATVRIETWPRRPDGSEYLVTSSVELRRVGADWVTKLVRPSEIS